MSATGIQQGDPFGPALFCLAVDESTRKVHTEFNVWYLDDGTIGDTPENVYSNVKQLVDSFRELGLQINQDKCELIILSHRGTRKYSVTVSWANARDQSSS